MGDIKMVSAGSLKKGSYLVVDGAACTVVDTQTSRPGKHGHAKVRILAVGMIDGKKREAVMPGHDSIEVPMIDKRNATVLSITGTKANVMDAETYETFDMDIPEDIQELTAGNTVLYWVVLNDKVMKQIKPE